MGRHDWYRNRDWNDEIEARFKTKLGRARSSKPQYLRIQAHTLAKNYPHVALELLDQFFDLGENSDMAQAYVDKAIAFLALERVEDAIVAFEAALRCELVYPYMLTNAYLDLPYLIAVKSLKERFAFAFELLDTHKDRLTFAVDCYKWNAAKALILASQSDIQDAQHYAEAAIEAANIEHSGFRHHPTVGLFSEATADQATYDRIKKIAAIS